jgi:hypothetical protein
MRELVANSFGYAVMNSVKNNPHSKSSFDRFMKSLTETELSQPVVDFLKRKNVIFESELIEKKLLIELFENKIKELFLILANKARLKRNTWEIELLIERYKKIIKETRYFDYGTIGGEYVYDNTIELSTNDLKILNFAPDGVKFFIPKLNLYYCKHSIDGIIYRFYYKPLKHPAVSIQNILIRQYGDDIRFVAVHTNLTNLLGDSKLKLLE